MDVITSLSDLTHSVFQRGNYQRSIREYRTSSSDIFLGALVTITDAYDIDVDLAQDDELIYGVVCDAPGLGLEYDHDQPFKEETYINVYTFPDGQAWCWCGGQYRLLELSRVIGRPYNEVEREFVSRTPYFINEQMNDPQIYNADGTQPRLKPKQEFKVSDLIILKLEGKNTNIYVNGKQFNQCKFLLLNLEKGKKYKNIESIDQAKEVLNGNMEYNHNLVKPEEAFWGHCSNLQTWVENDYNLNIIHTNLGFPLIRELIKYGDKKALIRFKEQIMDRVEKTGIKAYNMFKGDIHKYFNSEEKGQLFLSLESYKRETIKRLEEMPLERFLKLDIRERKFSLDDIDFERELIDDEPYGNEWYDQQP